ncbi:protein adenylyltransferase Fic [Methylobacillus sp.]|uniref:protein adenylyltransferase Fic n=1 Tax=Methylobacillus sp. TaxID=56818 RepID=UPI002FE272BE
MPWHPAQPYNHMPLLPPAQEQIETRPILKACIQARAALAALKQAGDDMPHQTLLLHLFSMLEAKDSSAIENIHTTVDRLFQHAHDEQGADQATQDVLRYRTALQQGYLQLQQRPLCSNTAVDLCSQLKGTLMDIRKVPGTNIKNQLTGEIVYTPPAGEPIIRDLLGNWEQYLHRQDDIDPLIKLAISHYQFEAIHPFHDGNGRTGRILNLLYLVDQGLLTLPILCLSRYILQHQDHYYRLLNHVTATDHWQDWIVFILDGITQTAHWTCSKITTLRALITTTDQHIRTQLPHLYSPALVPLLFEHPCCRIGTLVEHHIAQRQTASLYLKQLASPEIGVLTERQIGREKLFVHDKLLALLTQDS